MRRAGDASRSCTLALALLSTATALSGCNEPSYLQGARTLRTGSSDAGVQPDNDTFQVPVRRPSSDEKKALLDAQKALKLDQALPWIAVAELPLEVLYTVTNLDAGAANTVTFSLTGASEFGAYDPSSFVPAPSMNDHPLPPPPLAGATPLVLGPGESRALVFSEAQLADAALALEAIVRYPSTPRASTPYKVLVGRRGDGGPGWENVPAADPVPQLVRLRFALAATGPARVDYLVRVRDVAGKLAPTGSKALYP